MAKTTKKASAKPKPKAAPPTEDVRSIPLNRILPSPHNPRKDFDKAELEGLAASIRENGLLQPLIVMNAVGGNDRFELIAGHRRLKALEMNKAATALCIVRAGGTTATSRALQIIENLQRVDIPPLEEAHAFAALQDENKTHWTAAAIGRAVGKSDRFVAQRLAIARNLAPELQEQLAAGEIKVEVARTLASAPIKLQKAVAKDNWAMRDPDSLRRKLHDKAIPLSVAAFKVELYDGEFLQEDGKKWFADVAKFNKLQKTAAEARAEKLKADWPTATVVGLNELNKYVWAHDGGDVRTYWGADKKEAKKRRKGLGAEDCTALIYLQDHKIKTVRNVVLRETFEAKTEKVKPAERAEFTRQREDKSERELRALNERFADGLQTRPDLARRLMVYAFVGGFRGIDVHGDVISRTVPWSEMLAPFLQPDSDHYFEAYDPPAGAENKLWTLLRGLDDATVDAMLGSLASMGIELGPYGGHADHVTRDIAAELAIELPKRLLPKAVAEENQPPTQGAATLQEQVDAVPSGAEG